MESVDLLINSHKFKWLDEHCHQSLTEQQSLFMMIHSEPFPKNW